MTLLPVQKALHYSLTLLPIAWGISLGLFNSMATEEGGSPLFPDWETVLIVSGIPPWYFAGILCGVLLWAMCVTVWWFRFHGRFKADGWFGRNWPSVPGLLVPLAITLWGFPFLMAEWVTTLAVNALSHVSGASFYLHARIESEIQMVFATCLGLSVVALLGLPILASFTRADPFDTYYAGSRSLTASISGTRQHWEIHYHPGRDGKSPSGDFFQTEMANFKRELERLGTLGPTQVTMDSTLLAEDRYREKQDRLLGRIGELHGFSMTSETRPLSRFQTALRKVLYPTLNKRYAGQKRVLSRRVTLSRRQVSD